MARDSNRTRKAQKREKEKKDKWQKKPEKVYKKGKQPYFTLRKSTKEKPQKLLKKIEKKIEKNVREKLEEGKKPNILEIGPGSSPHQSKISTAGKKVYLDVEEGFLKDKNLSHEEKVKHKVGESKLPFKDKAFGPTVMNEVLTHVEPKKREQVVDELARVSDEVMITDRYFKKGSSKKVADPEKLKKEFKERGFDVEIEKLNMKEVAPENVLKKMPEDKVKEAGYFILHGKKKKQ